MKLFEFEKRVEEIARPKAERAGWIWGSYELIQVVSDELKKLDEVRRFEETHAVKVNVHSSDQMIQLSFELLEDNPLYKVAPTSIYPYFLGYVQRRKIKKYLLPCGIRDMGEDGEIEDCLNVCYEAICKNISLHLSLISKVYQMMERYELSPDCLRDVSSVLEKFKSCKELTIQKNERPQNIFDPTWQTDVLMPAAQTLGVEMRPVPDVEC